MKHKLFFLLFAFCSLLIANSCSKHDPILPGDRTPVFPSDEQITSKGNIPESVLSDSFAKIAVAAPQTQFTQNLNNEIFDVSDSANPRKIFAGFPSDSKINVSHAPLFFENYVFAGLTTGEVVKVNPKNREVAWVADVYKSVDMLGGNTVLDIVAPIIIDNERLFAGGMGGEFCSLKITTGDKKWCREIAVAVPFQIAGDLAFVVGTDDTLSALDANRGEIYWKAKIQKQSTPKLMSSDGKYFVIVGKEKFDAQTGKNLANSV